MSLSIVKHFCRRDTQDHKPYDESVYIAKLELRGSPLAKLIPTAAEQAEAS
jgi:hypothetical protein